MKKIITSLSALVFLSCVSFQLSAQVLSDSTQTADVFDFSLEELLNLEITVASKKAEKISDAPGSITAYSKKDIEDLGYYTLADLASVTAGYSAPKGLNVSQFETRGQYTSGGFDNNKHLILVDGIPVYNARANMASSEEVLPLLGVQRVEFLRGPGSALYGIGAFNGVVNVISRDLEENGTKIDGSISLGNYDAKKRIMFSAINKSDAGIVKISGGFYSKESTNQLLGDGKDALNGDDLNAGKGDANDPDQMARYQDYSRSIYMNASYQLSTSALRGLKTGVIYQHRSSGLGEWWMDQQNQTYPFTESQFEQFIPYIKYERDVTDKLSVNTYLKKNYSYEKYAGSNGWQASLYWSGAGLSFFKLNVNETEYFGEARYEANDKLSLVGGVNVVSRFGTGAPENYIYYVTKDQGTLYNYSADFSKRTSTYNNYSVFGQAQYKVDFLAGLKITGGARLDLGRVKSADDNKLTNKFDQLSPRIALVQKITEHINFKLMYGKALRAPMIKEVGANEEAKAILERDADPAKNADAVNVPDLNAETIDSYEASVTYNDKVVSAALTVFANNTENALYRGATNTGQPITQNISGDIKANGIEIEASVVPVKNIKLTANYATAVVSLPEVYVGANNVDTIAGGKPFNTPTHKFNGMVTYNVYEPMKASVALVYSHIFNYNVGGYSPWRKSGSNMDDFDGVYANGGQGILDLNVRAEITKNLGVEVQVRNLANVEYRTPAFFGSRALNVPGAGRSILGTVSYKF